MKRYLLVFLSAILIAGCVTPPISTQGNSPAIAAFRYYRENAEKINHNTVVAALSYNAASIHSTRHTTWEGYAKYFNDAISTMKRTGQVRPNYPVKINAYEIRVFRRFTEQWVATMRWNNVKPADAKEQYPAHVAALIDRINSYEYRK